MFSSCAGLKRWLSVYDAYFCVKYEPLFRDAACPSQYVRVELQSNIEITPLMLCSFGGTIQPVLRPQTTQCRGNGTLPVEAKTTQTGWFIFRATVFINIYIYNFKMHITHIFAIPMSLPLALTAAI